MNFKPVLEFLKDLAKNNNKEWFEANKPTYQAAREAFLSILDGQYIPAIAQWDEDIEGLKAKDAVFRIYRDIRFSKDKTPYKISFAASIAPGGRKGKLAKYYLHVQPEGETVLAGGMYMPEADVLKKIRQEVDYNASELKKIVEAKTFKEYFGQIQGEKLKRPPKGYDADHPNIEFLKLKSFFVFHKASDKEVLSPGFFQQSMDIFKAMQPFNEFLNVAVS